LTDSAVTDATLAPVAKPATKPARPYFSSGPCAKPPGWSPEKLATESLGRSHRSKIGKTRLQYAIDLMRELLQLPDTHRIGIVPASDTGAVEMALWSMLGATAGNLACLGELRRRLGHRCRQAIEARSDRAQGADYGELPDLDVSRSRRTMCSSPGTARHRACAFPMATGFADDREGLSFADATSGACSPSRSDWNKVDVGTFSWQKALGGEGGPWCPDPRPARGRAARKLHPGLAAAQDLPHDRQGRQARSRASSRVRRSTRRRCSAVEDYDLRARMGDWSIGGLEAP
jgi:phosphoserine aminotransferase